MGRKSRAKRDAAPSPEARRAPSVRPAGAAVSPALRWGVPALVAVIIFLCFVPALSNGFVNWDDEMNIVKNRDFRGLGLAQLAWMFTDLSGHYIPVTWMSLGLDYLVWDLDPTGYHLTNLLLHTANGVLCFALLVRLLRAALCGGAPSELAVRVAAAAGALSYAIHPLRVESVVWATERRDVLAGMFFLLTLLGYLAMQRQPDGSPGRRRWYALSLVTFALSLLSKAMGMTLPVALLVLDVFPLARYPRRGLAALVREKIPYLLLSGAAAVMTIIAQRHVKALAPMPAIDVLLHPGYRLGFYAAKTLVPLDLSPLYPYVGSHGRVNPLYALAGLAVIAATLALVRLRRRWPEGLAAWACHVVLIAPVIGVVQVGPHFAADRNTYFAALPWAAVVAAALLRAASARQGDIRWWGRVVPAVAVVVLAALGVLSFRQSRLWKDSMTLWTHALAIDPNLEVGRNNRGLAREEKGDLAGALEDYDVLLKINPRHADALLNRGNTKAALGNPEGAVADYNEALRLKPDFLDAYNGRGAARGALGDQDGAIADYNHALQINPRYMESYNNRGHAKAAKGDAEGALADFAEALRLDPRATRVYANRGQAHAKRGDHKAAIEEFTRALTVGRPTADTYNDRGIAWATLGELDKAVADFEAALKLEPRLAKALNNRGLARARSDQLAAAIADYEQAILADPRYPDAYSNRGAVRASQGDLAGAAADFEQALKVAPPTWGQRAVIESLLVRARQGR